MGLVQQLPKSGRALPSDGRPTAENLEKSASEVRIEDVVDDRIQHRAAVLQPLEGCQRACRDVRLTALAGAVDEVRREERQIEHDEHREQNAEDTYGATAAVRTLQRRTAGLPSGGTTRLHPPILLTEPRSHRRRQIASRRPEQRLDVGPRPRTVGPGRTRAVGSRPRAAGVPDRLQATQTAAAATTSTSTTTTTTTVLAAVDAELVDRHTALFTQLTTQCLYRQCVHDGHDRKWNVERCNRRRDYERLRLRTTTYSSTSK